LKRYALYQPGTAALAVPKIPRNDLSGRVAIVTGGGSGIGAALCKALALENATVIVADLDPARAALVASGLGAAANAATLDVRDAHAFEQLIEETARRYGKIDYLFNNAGILSTGEVRDMEPATWRDVIETNLFGVVHGLSAAYRIMLVQGSGHIVNIASQAGLLPSPLYAPYAASKAAVVAISNAARLEARGLGVRISVVCPGNVDTNIFRTSRTPSHGGDPRPRPRGKMPPEKAAAIILAGVRRDSPMIVFPATTMIMWLAYRLWPSALDLLQLEVLRRFRKSRTSP
jgi:NAD(P)-dependent dehydrogenase (short-subunit alcohol dehydrogenase family)